MPEFPVTVPELTSYQYNDLRRCVDRWDRDGEASALMFCRPLHRRGLVIPTRHGCHSRLWLPTDLGRAALAAHEAAMRKDGAS